MIPERARSRLLDLASTQLPSGGAYHQYQPLTKRGNDAVGTDFNDDPLWLVIATAAYIRETGDLGILDEPAPYDGRPGSETPLFEHLQRCITYTLDRLGPHGLPLIGRADWNDCLNLNSFAETPGESFQAGPYRESGVAESVVIAALFLMASREMSLIADRRGDPAEAARCVAGSARLRRALDEHAWDGAWFRRAYDSTGSPVGASDCDEGQVFIEPQGLCVMAGVGLEDGRAAAALSSVRKRLATPHGIVLLDPPYTRYSPLLGEISSYPPGYKENGSVSLPCQPLGDDRGDAPRARRRRPRLLPADVPVGSRGHLGGPSLRALRARADDRRPRFAVRG